MAAQKEGDRGLKARLGKLLEEGGFDLLREKEVTGKPVLRQGPEASRGEKTRVSHTTPSAMCESRATSWEDCNG